MCRGTPLCRPRGPQLQRAQQRPLKGARRSCGRGGPSPGPGLPPAPPPPDYQVQPPGPGRTAG
eukprot:15471387-Alexandrium_andersonii.AAC.1